MPKDRGTRSASFERHSRASPYPCSSSTRRTDSPHSREPPEHSLISTDTKEWEDVRCPVCMEHPHNAVLLLCSSHDKGCRPFMCDTSYRHSNCLDQYKKAFSGSKTSEGNAEDSLQNKLSCPLCRGLVNSWMVLEPARWYMNTKNRSCSMESCAFSGTYAELRKHARKDHPSGRPSEVDPERQQDWRRIEQQRDLGDLFSMFRSDTSADEELFGTNSEIEDFGGRVFAFPSFTLFLVVQVSQQGGTDNVQPTLRYRRSSPRNLRTVNRRGRRVFLWGETLNEADTNGGVSSNVSDAVEDNADNDGVAEEGQHRRRRQQRMPHDEADDEDETLL